MPPHALTSRNGQQYTYDLAGRQKTSPGRTITYTAFLADGRAVAEVTKVQAAPTGPVTQPSEVLYLHDDAQGNVVQATDANGQVRDRLFFDPFGRTDGNTIA
jgi:YD repeat-containing protein